jgi:hypothetical protein
MVDNPFEDLVEGVQVLTNLEQEEVALFKLFCKQKGIVFSAGAGMAIRAFYNLCIERPEFYRELISNGWEKAIAPLPRRV